MNWFVYTLGDSGFFFGVLNGVAMIFNSAPFRGDPGSFGGSVIFLVFMFALIAVLMSALISQWKQGNNPTILLILFIIWMVGGYTKATVVVEDIYTGSARSVDNVPLLVAVPASVITSVAMELGTLFQTAFQSADTDANEMTTDGFMNPLKLMLSVRKAASYSPYMTSNWGSFVKHCVIGSSSPQVLLSNSYGVYGALSNADNLTAHRHMQYFARDSVTPSVLSCADAGPQIEADLDAYFSDTNTSLNRAMRDATGRNMTMTSKTWSDLANFYATNSTLAGIDAQRTSANIMMHQTTTDVFKCGNNSTDPSAYFQCTQLLSDQQQAFAVDAAAGGAGFTRTVITSMGFLLALFIGLSPLVLLVAIASGANALPLIGKYMMFGAWTQSWLPAAFLVNYFVHYTWTRSMQDLLDRSLPVPIPANSSLPLDVVPVFWMETMDKIAVASDLLAAVPLITLAAMTGSYFALAKLGERWSGKDYANERMVTPSLANVAAVSSNSPMQDFSMGAGGQISGAARVRYNLQDGLSQSVSDKEQEALRIGSEVSRDWSQGGKFSSGWERLSQTVKSDASQASQTWGQAVSFADKMTRTDSFGDKIGDSEKSELQGALRAGVQGMLLGNGLGGVVSGNFAGVSQKSQEWVTNTQEGKEWANAIKSEFGQTRYSSLQGSESIANKYGFSEDETAQIRESLSTQAATLKAHEEATQIAANVGGSYTGNAGELTTSLRNAGLYGIMAGMHSTLYTGTDENSRRYQEAYGKIARHEVGQGVSEFDGQLGWIAGALMGSGHHDKVLELGQHISGAQSLNTPAVGAFDGAGAPVTDLAGKTLADLKAQAGTSPTDVPSIAVDPSLEAAAAGPMRTSSDLTRPDSNGPARPNDIKGSETGGKWTFEDGEKAANMANEAISNPSLGAGAAMGEAALDTVVTPVKGLYDSYQEFIGQPFADGVYRLMGIETNTQPDESPVTPQTGSDRVR